MALLLLRIERALSKWIQCEQPVIARVPIRGMMRVLRMVEYRDTEPFPIHLRSVIDPIRALPPHVLHASAPVRVHHYAALLLREIVGQPDGERAFLGIAERHVLSDGQGDLK